ncbi:hypothetical protein RUM43_007457 [Polyplax serrata]|uniref:C2H2-type domain-containing protein n=1 Tax=Polyplax serrata TaxID=468196 RepID=A0AAN8PX71_POLSC
MQPKFIVLENCTFDVLFLHESHINLVCGKVFGNASALAKHKLTHSDERKYVCTMCGKAFKRQDHLNGHMLTHRNKKPYECKAEGCGKSYCDARSLRRHTENHHTGSNASSTGGTREVTSPLASSCIQYAPPTAYQPSQYPTSSSPASSTTTTSSTPTKAPSHLQQLLASDSTTSATSTASSTKASTAQSVSNDGLTKQQLDLIHQIMQQTQQQTTSSQQIKQKTANGTAGNSNGVTNTTAKLATTAAGKTKAWTVQGDLPWLVENK